MAACEKKLDLLQRSSKFDLKCCSTDVDPVHHPLRTLTQPFELHLSSHHCCTAVWNKVLNGMWKSNSSLPLERSVLIQNAAGHFVATQPVDSLDFPFTKAQLPDSFMSPAWSHVQDPTGDSETPIDSVVSLSVSESSCIVHDKMRCVLPYFEELDHALNGVLLCRGPECLPNRPADVGGCRRSDWAEG